MLVSNGVSPCITKLVTWVSMSWCQRKAPAPQMYHNPLGVKNWYSSCHWLIMACDSEVITSLKGSAQPLFSLLPYVLFLLLPLPKTPMCSDATHCLRQPANKSSYTAFSHSNDVWACRGYFKTLSNKIIEPRNTRFAGLSSNQQQLPRTAQHCFQTGITCYPRLFLPPGSLAKRATHTARVSLPPGLETLTGPSQAKLRSWTWCCICVSLYWLALPHCEVDVSQVAFHEYIRVSCIIN